MPCGGQRLNLGECLVARFSPRGLDELTMLSDATLVGAGQHGTGRYKGVVQPLQRIEWRC